MLVHTGNPGQDGFVERQRPEGPGEPVVRIKAGAISCATTTTSATGGNASRRGHPLVARVRPPRSAGAPSQGAPAGSGQLALVQALVGQRLSIPCSNRTGGGAAAADHHHHPQAGQAARSRAPAAQRSRGQTSAADRRHQWPAAATSGVSLIVWHKDDQLNSPIFVADARGAGSFRDAKQQAGAESLRGRAHLEVEPANGRPGVLPALLVDDVTVQEAGIYTCTVEFHKAPTQAYQVRVIVVGEFGRRPLQRTLPLFHCPATSPACRRSPLRSTNQHNEPKLQIRPKIW